MLGGLGVNVGHVYTYSLKSVCVITNVCPQLLTIIRIHIDSSKLYPKGNGV